MINPQPCPRNLPTICEREGHESCLLFHSLSRNQIIHSECERALKGAVQNAKSLITRIVQGLSEKEQLQALKVECEGLP